MELRLYAFTIYYLSSIQHGIQTGHAAVKLVRKYADDVDPDLKEPVELRNTVTDWADNHQTFITLSGGNYQDLREIEDFIEKSGYPFVSFSEDQASLNGMLTCIAVVLPAYIFDAKIYRSTSMSEVGMALIQPLYEVKFWEQDEERTRYFYPGEPETAMISLIKSCRLAQ